MMRECIICGRRYQPKRSDSTTCGQNSCRCKLSRMRQKAQQTAAVQSLSAQDTQLLEWLRENIPAAENELRTLHSIYGKRAYEHAVKAMRALAQHQRAPAVKPVT